MLVAGADIRYLNLDGWILFLEEFGGIRIGWFPGPDIQNNLITITSRAA